MAHFNRKFIIHKGKRKTANAIAAAAAANHSGDGKPPTSSGSSNEVKMYQLRKNPYSAICTRCIQLETAEASNLCSEFCFIVCVPFNNNQHQQSSGTLTKGIVYVWIGSKSNPDEARIAEEIARDIYDVFDLEFHFSQVKF